MPEVKTYNPLVKVTFFIIMLLFLLYRMN